MTSPTFFIDAAEHVDTRCFKNFMAGKAGTYNVNTTCNDQLLAAVGCDGAQCESDLADHARRSEQHCIGLSEAECSESSASCSTPPLLCTCKLSIQV